MPKTIRNQFYKKLTFEKLLQAHYRARKHKAYKNEVIKLRTKGINHFKHNLELLYKTNKIKKGTI